MTIRLRRACRCGRPALPGKRFCAKHRIGRPPGTTSRQTRPDAMSRAAQALPDDAYALEWELTEKRIPISENQVAS